jgi:hypothetical protein
MSRFFLCLYKQYSLKNYIDQTYQSISPCQTSCWHHGKHDIVHTTCISFNALYAVNFGSLSRSVRLVILLGRHLSTHVEKETCYRSSPEYACGKRNPLYPIRATSICFNNIVSNLCNNSAVEKTNGMTFNPTATLKLIYWFIYHQSIVHFQTISSIIYPYVPINPIYFVNCYCKI